VTGAGHVVCYNRITNFADAIDTFDSPRCEAIDFHNNDVGQMTDDGMELDYSRRNVRCSRPISGPELDARASGGESSSTTTSRRPAARPGCGPGATTTTSAATSADAARAAFRLIER
jgi:hypothetical protein